MSKLLQSRIFWIWLVIVYAVVILIVCFSPQNPNPALPTPGVFYRERLAFLFIPFNSFWNLGQATSLLHAVKIIVQNIMNVFLLYPLVLGCLILKPFLRTAKGALLLGFLFSLSIELPQLLVDYLWDFNRVFEIDDLWTNTLGAYLAYRTYLFLDERKMRP
ncbi:VanZ family protein [Streptococcus sp. 10F2]